MAAYVPINPIEIWKTDKDTLSEKEILQFIEDYEMRIVPGLNKLWDYYKAQNYKITHRAIVDENNPDNRTPVAYGRKIVTTFTGYAYRPGYITYQAKDEKLLAELNTVNRLNKEKIKTSRAGRNTAIFGAAYEIVYADENSEARFMTVDPRELILLYDYSPEAEKKIGIRYFETSKTEFKVEVYYAETTEKFIRKKETDSNEWVLIRDPDQGETDNIIHQLPIVAYYFSDDILGIINPVHDLINDYDVLLSDSMNEFDRFAMAYLILKKMRLGNSADPKEQRTALKMIKYLRVFQNVPDDSSVSFLTKDIPSEFITFMEKWIREQIHEQSHVPDFSQSDSELSGVAIERLMFDFENVVSSAEAEFDCGLYDRMELLAALMAVGQEEKRVSEIIIVHRRNTPKNVSEFAEIALKMKQAGFSRDAIIDNMPEEMITDKQEELVLQIAEQTEMLGADVDLLGEEGAGQEVAAVTLNGAQIVAISDIAQQVALGKLSRPEAVNLAMLIGITRAVAESVIPQQGDAEAADLTNA